MRTALHKPLLGRSLKPNWVLQLANHLWCQCPLVRFPRVSTLPVLADGGRPLSVSFQFRASGKETDMATMLRLEKYGRIDFSLGRWTTTDQNAPKSMRAHVKLSGELTKTKIRSLSRPQQPLFNRSSFRLHQNGVNLADITTNFTQTLPEAQRTQGIESLA